MTATAKGYLTVTPDELEQLRIERIRALELDHARTVLLCREVLDTGDETGPFQQLAEIERRIHVHLAEPRHAAEGGDGAENGEAPTPVVLDSLTGPEASTDTAVMSAPRAN